MQVEIVIGSNFPIVIEFNNSRQLITRKASSELIQRLLIANEEYDRIIKKENP